MSWQIQWQSLSHRIGGLLDAVRIFVALFQAAKEDAGTTGKYEHINRVLLPQAKSILSAVNGLWEIYGDVLPSSATEAVQFYSSQLKGAPATGLVGLLGMTTLLAAMKSELDYLLADQEAVTVAVVERAFEHLQRTIAVDVDQRESWKKGFSGKETQCEKMGATHLLWHGIWAFKVNAAGERTDLVLGTPAGAPLDERVRASGSRLVLTEWKLFQDKGRLETEIKRAVNQLRLYSQGSLAGVELRTVRYVVVVSEHRLNMPPDQALDGILYRLVNIATEPETPAQSVRRGRGRARGE